MKKEFKYIFIFLSAFLLRLIPFKAPNLESVMASVMPVSKSYSKVMSFMFGFLSIILFDLITSGIGIWTIITAFAYGLLGLGASYYFQNRGGWKSYATYAFMGTIAYDCLTGLTIGPIFFGQSFVASLVGQVPFTIIHLIGNVSFAIILSPILEKWLATESVKSFSLSKKAVSF